MRMWPSCSLGCCFDQTLGDEENRQHILTAKNTRGENNGINESWRLEKFGSIGSSRLDGGDVFFFSFKCFWKYIQANFNDGR